MPAQVPHVGLEATCTINGIDFNFTNVSYTPEPTVVSIANSSHYDAPSGISYNAEFTSMISAGFEGDCIYDSANDIFTNIVAGTTYPVVITRVRGVTPRGWSGQAIIKAVPFTSGGAGDVQKAHVSGTFQGKPTAFP
jgi:hypothetical protein